MHVRVCLNSFPVTIIVQMHRVGHRMSVVVKVTTGTDGASGRGPSYTGHVRVRSAGADISMEDIIKVVAHGNGWCARGLGQAAAHTDNC